MWLQHQSKRQLRLEKADSKRNVTLIASRQIPIDWLRHAGAKPREEAGYSAARQDTSSDRDCRFDQKEESSMIGRDLFNIPCRICRRPTIHRTRTREEEPFRRAEEEEEKGEGRARRGNGAFEAWNDGVMDRVGVASQGCVCLARASEIERDGSVFLFTGEYRESGCA